MPHTQTLYQFQCDREGHLFYLQSGFSTLSNVSALVKCCPQCKTARFSLTGRKYPALDEEAAMPTVKEG